jgi:hypothetical protein
MIMTEQDQELVPFLVLNLDGVEGRFRAFRKANQWALMQSANADKTGKMTDQMAANFQVVTTSVLPEDRAKLGAYMMEHGYVENLEEQLFEALGKLWAGETMLPLERESTDGSASISETSSTSTPNSSELESDVSVSTEGLSWADYPEEIGTLEESGSSSPV